MSLRDVLDALVSAAPIERIMSDIVYEAILDP